MRVYGSMEGGKNGYNPPASAQRAWACEVGGAMRVWPRSVCTSRKEEKQRFVVSLQLSDQDEEEELALKTPPLPAPPVPTPDTTAHASPSFTVHPDSENARSGSRVWEGAPKAYTFELGGTDIIGFDFKDE